MTQIDVYMSPSQKAAIAVENQALAFDLKKKGYSFPEIATTLEVTVQTVQRYIKKAIKELSDRTHLSVREMVDTDLARIESYIKAMEPQLDNGNLDAIDRVMKLLDRRAKLAGLDAPSKIAPTSPNGEFGYQSIDPTKLTMEQLLALKQATIKTLTDEEG